MSSRLFGRRQKIPTICSCGLIEHKSGELKGMVLCAYPAFTSVMRAGRNSSGDRQKMPREVSEHGVGGKLDSQRFIVLRRYENAFEHSEEYKL